MKWTERRHLKSKKHWATVNDARVLFDRGYRLRDIGQPVAGFDLVLQASMLMSDCGCPMDLWPQDIQQRFA